MTREVLNQSERGRAVIVRESDEERAQRQRKAAERAQRVLRITRGQARTLRRAGR